jgi:hypothetical protein
MMPVTVVSPDSPSPPPRTLEARLVGRFPSLAYALQGLDGWTAWILLVSALLLVWFRKFGGSGYFETDLRPEALASHPYLSVYGDWYWFAGCFFWLGLVPVLLSGRRALRPQALGLGLGDWRFGLKWLGVLVGVMVPVVLIASRFSTFWRFYPLNGTLGHQAGQWVAGQPVPDDFLLHFVVYELLYALYFVGWEFFFRGFMTFGLHARMGVHGLLVANIPFALLHVGKPFPEALGSIVAGVALGLFALRARSFWYCFILHTAIAWTMDAAAIARRAQELGGG